MDLLHNVGMTKKSSSNHRTLPSIHMFTDNNEVKVRNMLSGLKNRLLGSMINKFGADKNILVKKDNFRGVYSISGQQCHVVADIINGKVTGNFSCKRSNKNFKFEFRPVYNSAKGSDIYAELSRLYLDLRQDKYGKMAV